MKRRLLWENLILHLRLRKSLDLWEESEMSNINKPLFGLCPLCNRTLVYNSKNELIVCLGIDCDFTREYTAKDKATVNEAAAERFQSIRRWGSIYGDSFSLEDQQMVRAIFDKTKD